MLNQVSPEFRLVAAACRWPPGEAVDGAVIQVAAAAPDWDLVLRIAARHRVEGLVWHALQRTGAAAGSAATARLRDRARAIAAASLAAAAESARLCGALEAAGLRALVLKGTVVEILAYGQLGLKDAHDIDLLVAPDTAQAGLAVLQATGYRLTEPAGLAPAQLRTWIAIAKELELEHVETGQVVELHWRLADGPSLLPGVTVVSPSQTVKVGSALELRGLADAELYSYLCVHGAMHAWSRLKWIADVSAWLGGMTPAAVVDLHRAAERRGVGACSGQALLLAHEALELPIDPTLLAELSARPRLRWLVKVAWTTMAGGGAAELEGRPFAHTRVLLSHLFLGSGLGHALQEIRYRAISLHDRTHMPLPRGWSFLYPILRGPMWLGRRLGLVRRG